MRAGDPLSVDQLIAIDPHLSDEERMIRDTVRRFVRERYLPRAAELFEEVRDGEALVVRGSSLFRNGSRLAAGRERGAEELARDLADQQSRVSEALEAFAENTLRHLREETALLAGRVSRPAKPGSDAA